MNLSPYCISKALRQKRAAWQKHSAAIKALVQLGPELQRQFELQHYENDFAQLLRSQMQLILAAIAELKVTSFDAHEILRAAQIENASLKLEREQIDVIQRSATRGLHADPETTIALCDMALASLTAAARITELEGRDALRSITAFEYEERIAELERRLTEAKTLWRIPIENDKSGREYLLEMETPTNKYRWRAVASYRHFENGDSGWAEDGKILCQDDDVKLLIPMTDLLTIPPLPSAAPASKGPAEADVERVRGVIYRAISEARPEADWHTVAARAAIAAIGRT